MYQIELDYRSTRIASGAHIQQRVLARCNYRNVAIGIEDFRCAVSNAFSPQSPP